MRAKKGLKTRPKLFKSRGLKGSLVKSAVCVTVDRNILKWISVKIEERVFASRSHAVEYAVAQLMKNDRGNTDAY